MHYGDVSDQKLARTTWPETHRSLEDLETRQMTWDNVYKPVKRAIKTQESSKLPSLPPWKGLKLKRETSNNAGKKIIRLFYEMIFIAERKPILNKQWDYIRAKLFLEPIMFLIARTKHVSFVLCFFFCHSELCKLSYVFVFLSSILSLDNDVSDIKTWCKALFAISKLWNFEKNKRCRKLNPASAKWSF